MTKRLAIIGAGSSGLIALKNAIDQLPEWEIFCFEASGDVRGCWGSPNEGFVSTSTKYTTQYACYQVYDASVKDDGGASRNEFFCDREYGDYLEAFADRFELRPRIRLNCSVQNLRRDPSMSRWILDLKGCDEKDSCADDQEIISESFDAVILATGLASKTKSIETIVPSLDPRELQSNERLQRVKHKKVVVFGGGESAVDVAKRLAEPSLFNDVFLSLRSGIRVSPRYHPIRGVPSDFLRNRLLLSLHPDLRNWIGGYFVRARIRYQDYFVKFFPSSTSSREIESEHRNEQTLARRKRDWSMILNGRSKGQLFDMFHNKSDDFLDWVARGEITLLGEPEDETLLSFKSLKDPNERIQLSPDLVVPAIGYRSTLTDLSNGEISEQDFYLGCCHVKHSNLFLIGFARPIIGNIPTISEMQARFVTGILADRWQLPQSKLAIHRKIRAKMERRFAAVDMTGVYPVEMFPYCDELAKRMNAYPTLRRVGGLWKWWRMQLEPATTAHYSGALETANVGAEKPPVYLPKFLVFLLLVLKPIDEMYRMCLLVTRRFSRTESHGSINDHR